MCIYTEALEQVHNGERFYIDFVNRTMKIGRHKVIDCGVYDETKSLYDNKPTDIMSTIAQLYKSYKYSTPSERSDSKRRKYFKALSVEELTDEQMITGANREVAQFELEAFILCSIINGDFVWNENYGKWFFQHQSDRDLVILRSWIEK